MSEQLSLQEKIKIWRATGLDVVLTQDGLKSLDEALDDFVEAADRRADSARASYENALRRYNQAQRMLIFQVALSVGVIVILLRQW